MVRHPKGAQVRAFFSAHEKEKFDLGTQRLRLTEDSQRIFDQCQLCLNPLKDPIATPSGYLYCRSCIIPNLMRQKQINEELMVQYREQERRLHSSAQYEEQRKQEALIAAFEAQERGNILSSTFASTTSSSSSSSFSRSIYSDHHDDARTVQTLRKEVEQLKTLRETKIDPRDKETKLQDIKDTAYWIAIKNPTAEPKNLSKPSTHLLDPVANIPIKLKDLVRVDLHRIRPLGSDDQDYNTEEEEEENKVKDGKETTVMESSSSSSSAISTVSNAYSSNDPRFGCPSCLKGIVYQRTFLLKPCGHVFCDKCMIQFIAPNKSCLTCTKTVTKTDILPLQMGGSSFASHAGTQTIATKYNYTE